MIDSQNSNNNDLNIENEIRLSDVKRVVTNIFIGILMIGFGLILGIFVINHFNPLLQNHRSDAIVLGLAIFSLLIGIAIIVMSIIYAVKGKIFRQIGEMTFETNNQSAFSLIKKAFKKTTNDEDGEEGLEEALASVIKAEKNDEKGKKEDDNDDERRINIGHRHGAIERLELHGKGNDVIPKIKGLPPYV
jgi:hypothetical protein